MKSIWITGASSGIGKALALKFAKEGWQVAASARREDLLNKIAESNENISSFPLDVTDSEKCKEIFEQIKTVGQKAKDQCSNFHQKFSRNSQQCYLLIGNHSGINICISK